MKKNPNTVLTRRAFGLGTMATGLAAPALGQAIDDAATENDILTEVQRSSQARVKRNISSFSTKSWQPYFSNLKNGAILVDTKSRALHFWPEDESFYKLYPSSVPISDELTRLGRTKIIRKRVGPDWRPTPAMRIRNPEWPEYIPPGPDNPLGTHALYLTWTYYRIHGTHDTRKIGRRSSNGCIGLYNNHIEELYGLTKIGTQVLLI